MNRNKTRLGALLAALALLLAGCGGQQTPQSVPEVQQQAAAATEQTTAKQTEPRTEQPAAPDYDAIYRPVLNDFGAVLLGNETLEPPGATGVCEAAMAGEAAPSLVGYTVTDLTGDGVQELVVGTMEASEVLAVFTCVDGQPVPVLEGWARSRYHMTKPGCFFYEGASSAFSSAFGRCHLENAALVWSDFYFMETEPDDRTVYFYNTTGSWVREDSEQLDISEEDFETLREGFESEVQPLALTPFAEYLQPSVRADWWNGVDLGYDEVTAIEGEPQAQLVFFAEEPVTDFAVLAIQVQDIDENGRLRFDSREVYTQERLTPERPLVVNTVFYGDLPNNGIAYVDSHGMARRFLVEVSGADGTVLLREVAS